MYSVFHFKSATDINADIIEAIKAAFKGKPVVITVEEEVDETAFILSEPENMDMLQRSIAQDKNDESISVNIPDA